MIFAWSAFFEFRNQIIYLDLNWNKYITNFVKLACWPFLDCSVLLVAAVSSSFLQRLFLMEP